ncbi:protein FAR1-RELATED SEQUENCE 3-like [Citrus clementina]|uniref:protein FAR1-RELATED SEQUENCE 3-like n=1 Tax=Citrus clementina TaxID=85681 RepID=UPI000CED231A|nr:protein FAR1-RELATED SEQUENCE 3-like [Citrus x clementina]
MSELAACEKIYVPINNRSAHWYIAVLIVKIQIVEICDSLPSHSLNSHREEIVRAIIKVDIDPDFFCKYFVDEENRVANLFWVDSIARLDYSYFGDVLAFDSTYKTNEYRKPLVILLGVNNHYAITVFGCAILADEIVETYTWVLETFLFAMNNKKPYLSSLMEIERCIKQLKRPEEFEQLWKNMVEELGFQNNDLVKKIYSKLERWAEAFLRGHVFGGMHTTQRYKGVYTQKIFYKVRKQICKEDWFILLNNVTLLDIQVYTLTRHLQANKKWTVVYYLKQQRFECSCKKFESTGIPCPYLYCVMKHIHVNEMLASLINKRWTIDVKVYRQYPMPLESQSKDVLNNIRYGSLNAEFNETSFYAFKSNVAYWKLKGHLVQLKSEIKELSVSNERDRDRQFSVEKKARIVKNPLVVKTKGAPSTNVNKGVNTRKCGYCKQEEHTAQKC